MKKEEKRIILMIVVGIIIVLSVLIWKNVNLKKEISEMQKENTITEAYADLLQDGTKLNKSTKLQENRKMDGMEITEIQLTNQNGISVILATVTNTTSQDIELTPIRLTLYDDKGNKLEEIDGLISPIKVGESTQLNIGISADFANAYDLKIEKR